MERASQVEGHTWPKVWWWEGRWADGGGKPVGRGPREPAAPPGSNSLAGGEGGGRASPGAMGVSTIKTCPV